MRFFLSLPRPASWLLLAILIFPFSPSFAAEPPNDSCGGAIAIPISSGGYGLGNFPSPNSDLSQATVQVDEVFAPAIFGSGLDKKSIWYRFTLVTPRAVRVTLAQPGTAITAGDVGFAVYKSGNCIPGETEISSKLTPIGTFGNTYHPCVQPGEYLVQVSGNLKANGVIYISLELGDAAPSPYDKPATAYAFGKPTVNKITAIDFEVECQGLDNAAENCLPATAFKDYTKSTWHTFTTPDYFDFFSVLLAEVNGTYYGADYKVGYRIYEGDAKTAPGSLIQIGGCDSLVTNGYFPEKKIYSCGQLKPNTTYTIHLLYPENFIKVMRLAIAWNGTAPATGAQPTSSLPAPNKMGTLQTGASGFNNTASDYLACNTRHTESSCPNSLPVPGVKNSGSVYNLSTFFSFELATSTSISVTVNNICSPSMFIRVFKQALGADCNALDTANLIAIGVYSTNLLSCLEAGNYVIQILGQDTAMPKSSLYYGSLYTTTYPLCIKSNLGNRVDINIYAKAEVASNKFALNGPGKVNLLNTNGAGVMQPLLPYTKYSTLPDTLGCNNAVLPKDTLCTGYYGYPYSKAVYRELTISDSFMLEIGTRYETTKLYAGDANALATAQNIFNYPDSFSGLKPVTKCLSSQVQYACITSGTYTLASFDNRLGFPIPPIDIMPKTTKTKYASPATALDMGNLWDMPPVYYDLRAAGVDTFTCYDNPATIDGQAPCNDNWGKPRTKLIYRQFYIDQPTVLTIFNYYSYPFYKNYAGSHSLFKGKATDGAETLKAMGGKWSCFTYVGSGQCDALEPGWYTIVSYGYGQTFANPLPTNTDESHNTNVGEENSFYFLLAKACAVPKFNRPYRASVDTITKKPYLIEWGPRTGHSAAYPITSKTYTLNPENFNCSEDTTFIRLNMKSCNTGYGKVAFYSFQITQPSFVQINAQGYLASVYDFDVRTADSVKLKTVDPIQPCNDKTTKIEFCQLQPGYYTLVVYANASASCNVLTPSIYIDQVGFSRFDHAANAYDFGVLKADSSWHNGKAGDVNPLDAGRAPSNDFFYCTTGARDTDPGEAVCYNTYNPNIYPAAPNKVMRTDNSTTPNYPDVDRRNLWYTFTLDKPGNVRIRVDNKTTGKYANNIFAVYRSNVDGSLPFSTVQATAQVDSTATQGLTFLGANGSYCGYFTNEVAFYQEPCAFQQTRYYVLVEIKSNYHSYGYGGEPMAPNYQIEVSALLDSVTSIPPKFDHFSTAHDMGLVNSGIKKGEVDNFTCATKDPSDPIYAYTGCEKTLWYKFTTTVSGTVRYAAFLKNTNNYYFDQVQLLKQVKPNDSTSTGLKFQPYTSTYTNNGYWAEQCIAPGTYYLLLPGCSAVNEDVYAQIEVIPQFGDYCSAPVVAALSGAGSKVVPVRVDCHTIGTDYGEFNNTLSCPPNAQTATYKTSWYRLDIGGTDTLDVTVFINEKTNASSSEIKYRMMTGTCGAMQEQSCVLDALTQNTYKCLAPNNSYFIQVFTPVLVNSYTTVTGEIDLNISAVAHADTCAPLAPCLASANFTTTFNCATDEAVKFNNFSTYGTAIKYKWDFGYNGLGSTAVSPTFIYPALAIAKDYDVKLVIENTDCSRKDSVTRKITIPARPVVEFGEDLLDCGGNNVVLTATSFAGATYQWQDGSTNETFTATTKGLQQYWVKVTYNSCVSTDTINILISSVTKKSLQNFVLCAGDSLLLDENRGVGETHSWNNGATSGAILVKSPGIYWVDIKYQNCTIRDSFNVSSVTNASPLGKDTTICLAKVGYNLNATQARAVSYLWQDGSAQPTLNVTSGGLYWVQINFGKCGVRDSVFISNFADPINVNTVAVICSGKTYTLPWGPVVTDAGIYRDTIRYASGCDSLITRVSLSVNPKPNLGADKAVQVCAGSFIDLTKQFITTALTPTWTFEGAPVLTPTAVSAPGVYQLVAVNSAACTDTALLVLTNIPKLNLGADQALSVCPGTSFNLNAGFNITGLTTAWTIAGQPVANPAMAFNAGAYQMVASDAAGCADTAILTVSFNPKPVLGADQRVAICPGFSADLANLYNTTGLTITWTKDGAAIANPASVLPGIYQLIASTTLGCSDTALVTVAQNPKPAVGPDKLDSICPGEFVNLLTKYNVVGFDATWTFKGAGVSDPVAVATPGIYQLIVINEEGCSDTAFLTIGIYQKPTLGADRSVTVCSGTQVDLTTEFNTTSLTTRWTLNGVVVNSPDKVTTGGVYQLIATNASGCRDTATVTIQLNAKPNLGVDRQVAACTGFTTDLTKQFSTAGLSGQWTFNGNPVANPANVSNAGVYQLIVTNSFGCKDTALLTFRVDANPTLKITNPTPVCTPSTADLTLAPVTTGSSPSLSYTYWKNSAASETLSNASTAAQGSYFIKGTDANGCVAIQPVTVVVYPLPIVNAGRDTTICYQGTELLAAVAGNLSGGKVSYAWSPAPTLENPSNASTIARPAGSQEFTVTATVDYGACQLAVTDKKRVTMQAPVAAFAGNDTIAIKSVPIQLTASGGSTYLWSPSAPLNNALTRSPTATLQQTTRFIVTVRDGFGCAGTDTMFVRVYDGVTFFVPNAFSPNGDGLNDIFRPIPAGIATTEWFRIFNRYGELVFETGQTLKGWDGTFKGIKQAVGNYIWMVRAKGNDGKTIEMKGNVVLIR
ncbi:MAG: gliding motility-associated C-terminal domain-containing protein [Bacteroidota bacterium]